MPTDSHRCQEAGGTCPQHAGCACGGADDAGPSVVRGGVSAWSSMATFLLPIVLAIAGAVVLGTNAGTQLLGALAGLGVGMGASVLWARCIVRHRKKNA